MLCDMLVGNMNKEDKISAILGAWNDPWSLKMQLEKLTGKMVSFRSRANYNKNQRELQAKARRLKKLAAAK